MSIIEDALAKLQNKRNPPQEKSPHYPKRSINLSKKNRQNSIKKYIVVTAIMVVIFGGIWVGLALFEVKQNEKNQAFRTDTVPQALKQPTPLQDTPILVEEEEVTQPQKDGPESTNSTKSVSETKVHTQEVSEEIQEVPLQIKPSESIDQPPVIKKTTLKDAEKAEKESTIREKGEEESKVYPWIADGWAMLDEQKPTQALAIWKKGLGGEKSQEILLIAGVFKNRDAVFHQLSIIGIGHWGFIVEGRFKNKSAHYLLSLPPSAHIAATQAHLKKTLLLKAVKGLFVNKFLARLDEKIILSESKVALKSEKTEADTSKTPINSSVQRTLLIESDIRTHQEKRAFAKKTINKKTPVPSIISSVDPHTVPSAQKKSKKKSDTNEADKTRDDESKQRQARGKSIIESISDPTQQLMRKAQTYITMGHYEKAVETLDPALASTNPPWKLFFLLGSAYLGMKKIEIAESYLDKGIALDRRQAKLWVQKALVAQQKGENNPAIQFLLEAEKLNPKLPDIPLNKGYSYDMLGDYKNATQSYRHFLLLTENKREFLYMRRTVVKRLRELR